MGGHSFEDSIIEHVGYFASAGIHRFQVLIEDSGSLTIAGEAHSLRNGPPSDVDTVMDDWSSGYCDHLSTAIYSNYSEWWTVVGSTNGLGFTVTVSKH